MTTPTNFVTPKTEKEFNQLCLHNFDKLFVLVFFADWHEPSVHLTNVAKTLAKSYEGKCIFVSLNADENDAIAQKFNVELVPTVIFMKSTKEVIHRIEEDSPAILSEKVEQLSTSFRSAFEADKEKMFTKIDEIVRQSPVVVFIKGTPQTPKCGFSEQLLDLLKELRIKFSHFDILTDENIRNWTRHYSGWVTYPQVYIEGKFVGGLDITKDLIQKGEFQKKIEHLNIKDTPENIALRITSSGNVVALIDGKVSEPATLKSEQLVRVLNDSGIRYTSFDLQTADEALLKALKDLLGAEEFPGVVVEKKYVGDWRKVRELADAKELTKLIPKDDLIQSINEKLKALVSASPVMIFMKGVPDSPQCGFSRRMLDLLNKHGVKYGHFNILSDNVVRERLKEYSNWKTYPQLYVDGDLVGGLDICLEMDQSGEFFPLVEKYVQ